VPESPDRLVIRVACGQDADRMTGHQLLVAESLTGLVLTGGMPLISADTATDDRAPAPGTAWSRALGPASPSTAWRPPQRPTAGRTSLT
jgi:hypothetical protein